MGWWTRALDREPTELEPAWMNREEYDHDRHVQVLSEDDRDRSHVTLTKPKTRRKKRHRSSHGIPFRGYGPSTTSLQEDHRRCTSHSEHLEDELEKSKLALRTEQSTVESQARLISTLTRELAAKTQECNDQSKAVDDLNATNKSLRDDVSENKAARINLFGRLELERYNVAKFRRQLSKAEDSHRAEMEKLQTANEERESLRDVLIMKLASDMRDMELKYNNLEANWHTLPNVPKAMQAGFILQQQLMSHCVLPPWPVEVASAPSLDDVGVYFCQTDDLPYRVPIILPTNTACSSNARSCSICTNEYCDPMMRSADTRRAACKGFEGPWTTDIFSFPLEQDLHCDHAMDVCKTCIRDQISSQLETLGSKGWNKLACPLCRRKLTHGEIQRFASAEDFGKYERFHLIEHLSKEPDFRWCLSSTCESGQLYEDIPTWFPRITCSTCSFTMCFTHQTPWHSDLTCKEYDHKVAHAEEEAESEKWKETHTKSCPGKGCARPIEKGEGCFHMTCRECDWQFCWECLADWDEVKRDKLKHKEGCYFRTSDVGPMGVRGVTVEAAVG